MPAEIYYILHVLSLMLLFAVNFRAFADPDPRRRKSTLIWSGILSLLVLTGGFGLMARLQYDWYSWLIVKIGCWLWLSGVVGLAFRRPALAKPLGLLTTIIVGAALYMVYYKPALF
ncbi:MAG: hypothetical protein AAFZ65_08205 [Planctomycetota bacterium]